MFLYRKSQQMLAFLFLGREKVTAWLVHLALLYQQVLSLCWLAVQWSLLAYLHLVPPMYLALVLMSIEMLTWLPMHLALEYLHLMRHRQRLLCDGVFCVHVFYGPSWSRDAFYAAWFCGVSLVLRSFQLLGCFLFWLWYPVWQPEQ